MAAFSQFSSDLDSSTQKLLERGRRLTELLKQPQQSPMSVIDQVFFLFAGVRGFLDTIPVEHINQFEKDYLRTLKLQQPDLVADVTKSHALSEDNQNILSNFLKDFTDQWMQNRTTTKSA
jgi:F-type H+-transporting ATPase subunit alpha